MTKGKGGKMLQFINYQMKVTIQDTRVIIGRFMAYDKHMNVVLGDSVEYRKIIPKGKTKREERDVKRVLGLVVLRGECIVSISVEGPPLNDKGKKDPKVAGGPGRVSAVGRGVAVAPGSAPLGLAGPARGVGGPAAAQMMPQARVASTSQNPINYGAGRGVPPGMPGGLLGRGAFIPGMMGRGGPPPGFGGPMGPPGMMGRGGPPPNFPPGKM